MSQLHLFEPTIEPAFNPKAELVLYHGDVNDLLATIPDGTFKLIITSPPYNLGIIDAGIEIVPVNDFAKEMSTGVSYFEQFVWDLQQRGVADIDIPVMILGITA